MLMLLQREYELSRQLLVVLHEEHEQLRTRAFAALEQSAQRKQELLAHLQQCDRQRSQLLATEGLTADSNGMESWANRSEAGAALRQQWLELQQIATRCRDDNRRNGRLTALSQRLLRQLMLIFRGDSPPAQETYSADGSFAADASKPLAQV